MDVVLRWIWFSFDDGAHMRAAYALRHAVFVDEQGFTDADDRDARDRDALHVLGVDETGAACCTARLFSVEPGVWHAGRVAVRRALRGQGVGRLLMAAVAEKARALGGHTLELGAQADKQGFYAAVGFSPVGAPFLDAGYPHILMRMPLR